MIRSPRLLRDAPLLVIYFFLAILFTYPIITHLATQQPSHGVDDPALSWALWWVRYALFDLGANPLTSDFVFYPVGMNLAAYTPTFFNALLSIPFQFAFGVVPAQNLLIYFALVASGYGACLLTREIFARLRIAFDARAHIAAALAGAFFAFGAWHINYVWGGNFFLLHTQWIPFYALYLLRTDRAGWRDGARAGLFFVLTAWTELTFALFLAIFTAGYLILRFGRGFLRKKLDGSVIARSASATKQSPNADWGFLRFARNNIALAFISLIGLAPLAINLLSDTARYGYYLAAGVGRVQIFSAELISFFIPSARHPLLGAWAGALTDANTPYAFIGYAAFALALIGFFSRRAFSLPRFFAALAFSFAILMLGSTLIIGGQSTGIPLPFAILRAIPFVNANRYPVRFNVLLMLSLTPLIALGALRVLRAPRGKIILTSITALLAFEQLVLPIPLDDLRVPAIYQTIRDDPGDFAILELPLGWRGSIALLGKQDDRAQFYQTFHHKRLLGGITSRYPRFKTQYFLQAPVLNSLLALEDEREVDASQIARDRELAPEVLRFFDIRYVVLNRALSNPALAEYARAVFPLREIARDDERILYRVEPQALKKQIAPDDETAALYFDDRWGKVQIGADGSVYRWATANDSAIWLPLERGEQTITLRLRAPRANQKISVRVNGARVDELIASESWNEYRVRVPASVARDGLNEIIFSTETFPVTAPRFDDYAIGETGIISPVDIAATGAGFDAGRFGEIFVAGHNVIEDKRGYHLVAVNPQSGAVDRVASFDPFASAAESARLAQFIAALPSGEIVAGVAIDDVSQNLQAVAIDALRTLGVASDLRFQFRAGHAFIGVKGAAVGQAVEQV
ncbi:MAG: hypothetical protein HY070_12910, partial [Chloroflexi bacterium]|nr:hypothetical protein [Chloroflexota bacterium]